MEDYGKIYLVKIYLNKELIFIEHFIDEAQAKKSANFWEDKDYICEISVFEETQILSREEWREARIIE